MDPSTDEFYSGLQSLPCTIQRNINLIGQLEVKVAELVNQAEQLTNRYLANVDSYSPEEKTAHMQEINRLQERASALSLEKIALAEKSYDAIDWQIQRLDAVIPIAQLKSKSTGSSSSLSGNKKLKGMAVDPNEPLYCSCRQVSFGRMIACDGEGCPYEWFHYECVGLTNAPQEEQWFCSECSEKLMTESESDDEEDEEDEADEEA